MYDNDDQGNDDYSKADGDDDDDDEDDNDPDKNHIPGTRGEGARRPELKRRSSAPNQCSLCTMDTHRFLLKYTHRNT